jgi:CheY-like chemotaxis protein
MNRKKILLVDDDLAVLKTFAADLSAEGFEVVVAVDGGEAVNAVRNEQPDLILLDISFPPDVAHGGGVQWDGFLILNWLRRLDEAKGTPVIFLSESDPAPYRERARASGARGLFQKQLHHETLLATIHRILGPVAVSVGRQ